MARRKPQLVEKAEQEALVAWFKLRYPGELLAAIPNGLARPGTAAVSVKGGLIAGMPDLMLCKPMKGYSALFIEMKRPSVFGSKPGIVSVEQQNIIRHLNAVGYLAVVCYGWADAAKIIGDYLNE